MKYKLPTQNDIMSSWNSETYNSPQVSFVCITYNQELYIEDTLKGFLSQKTSFPFNIIIHDDASSDLTTRILIEYKRSYPKLIHLILQSDNQFSKSMFLPLKHCLELARSYGSRYVALCEGDDYWIDELKVEKQFLALERMNIDICFTSAKALSGNKLLEINNYGSIEKNFSLSEVVRGGGSFMPTASIFFKSEMIDWLPEWLYEAPVIDYYLQIICASRNGALYLPFDSCVYRQQATGSWTEGMRQATSEIIIGNSQKSLKTIGRLEDFNVSAKDIKKAKSSSTSYSALRLLLNNDLKNFNNMIKNSWSLYPFNSKLQVLLFTLKGNQNLLMKILKIANII